MSAFFRERAARTADRGATDTQPAQENGPSWNSRHEALFHPSARRMSRPPKPPEDPMKKIYHTLHFVVHDEKVLHEFVRKHADPEDFSAMEEHDADEAEKGEPVDHVYSDVEWIVENGRVFDAEGIEYSGGETGEIDEADEDDGISD
ncbi:MULTISPECIES: hypothetical protein [unclassified Bradyrhizobium]|uniref:hypothetical protein n=1 Tax=unclassified Bradyrhizobium TaxID=2631580 RepID=UPI0028EC9746|nr:MULTISPECIES: hypothetical protein [unclassified Bradyrhizobium]